MQPIAREASLNRFNEILSQASSKDSASFCFGYDSFPHGKFSGKALGNRGNLIKDNSLVKSNDTAAQFGANFPISSLASISREILEQKLYFTDLSAYVPVNVGEAPFSPRRFTIKSFVSDLNPMSGLITSNNKGQYNKVDVGIDSTYIDRYFWAKEFGWNMLEVQQMALLGNYSPIRELVTWLAKDYDLFQQVVTFYGFPYAAGTGLLTGDAIPAGQNNTAVNVNTSLITAKISAMSATQLNALVAGMITAYQANNAIYGLPDTFLVPQSDFTGMSTMIAPSFGVASGSPMELLKKMFIEQTGNPNFKIIASPYAQKTVAAGSNYKKANGNAPISYDRYVLYKNDSGSLELDNPVPFTLLGTGTLNNFDFLQLGYAQMGQVFNKRTQDMLYFDNLNS